MVHFILGYSDDRITRNRWLFMFRKFLKRLPKEDGKSELDWQDEYIQKSLHLWRDEDKQLLNELVLPVPELFRDVAKEK